MFSKTGNRWPLKRGGDRVDVYYIHVDWSEALKCISKTFTWCLKEGLKHSMKTHASDNKTEICVCQKRGRPLVWFPLESPEKSTDIVCGI